MTPYYQEDGITIYHGNCYEVVDSLPASFQCCITDPPYGETSLEWDKTNLGWIPLIADRLLEPKGTVWSFGSLKYIAKLIAVAEEHGWKVAQDLVWEKHNGSGFHADRFKRVHEHIVQFYRSDCKWADVLKQPVFTDDATKRTVRRKERPAHMGTIADSTYTSHDGGPRLMRSVIYSRSEHGMAYHPTQKPLDVLSPLIQYSTAEGDCILDHFMGSGSILVAAKRMGRKAVGIESGEQYCEAAAKRLSQRTLGLEATA